MIGTMTSFRDAMHVDRAEVHARTIFVDTMGVKATDFDIDEKTQNALFDNGAAAARDFLASWDFDRYIEEHRSA